jgi:hypothetical protein
MSVQSSLADIPHRRCRQSPGDTPHKSVILKTTHPCDHIRCATHVRQIPTTCHVQASRARGPHTFANARAAVGGAVAARVPTVVAEEARFADIARNALCILVAGARGRQGNIVGRARTQLAVDAARQRTVGTIVGRGTLIALAASPVAVACANRIKARADTGAVGLTVGLAR